MFITPEIHAAITTVINGCRKHLSYRGTKDEPKNDCEGCWSVYNAVQLLKQIKTDPIIEKTPGIVFNQLCIFCALHESHTIEEHVRAIANTRHGRK